MVEIPDAAVARRLINEAIEYGEWGDVHDTAVEGPHGQHSFDTEWSLDDLDPAECDVDLMSDEKTVLVQGEVSATYQVQTMSATYYPNSKAHPAEYETREITLIVLIEKQIDSLQPPEITVER